jgi:group I intron endonuclease
MACGIYAIYCWGNHKTYYGSTAASKTRWYNHKQTLKNNQHDNSRLQNAYNKYGLESFEYIWIEDISKDDLQLIEQQYLDFNIGGFNIATNAENSSLGRKHTEDSLHKMSVAQKGHSVSEERKHKIGDANRGRIKSAETCRKLSEKLKNTKLGEHNPAAKLTADLVRQLRSMREEGVPMRTLVEYTDVNRETVRRAILGINWGHIG